jgi:hypothetical protein
MQSNKESNQKLIERFPFLIPRNRWTGKVPEDYDYSYTELDSMPDGWRKAFGEQMCEDIRDELVHAEYLNQYRISQIKEKYGTLCWYDFGCTERMLRDISAYLREFASDVGTLQQRLLLAGSVPTVTLVLAKSVMPRDLFLLRNGSVEAEMRLHQKGL